MSYQINTLVPFVRRTAFSAVAGLALAISATLGAGAADKYPEKPISMIVPYASGSTTDITGRIFTEALTKHLGQTVLVVNRSNTVQGEIEVGEARPDGYTIGFFGTGAFSLAKHLVSVYPDPNKYELLVQLIAGSRVVAVSEASGFKTIQNLMEFGRNNPKKLLVGINPGTTSHLDSVVIMKAMGIEANYIPFKSGGERALAVSGGHVQVTVDSLSPLIPYADAKKVRILAIAAPERDPFAKDIPTLREQGVNADSLNIIGIFAPKGVPEDVLKVLEAAFQKTANDPEVIGRLAKTGQVPAFQNRAEFEKSFAEEGKRIDNLARELNISKK